MVAAAGGVATLPVFGTEVIGSAIADSLMTFKSTKGLIDLNGKIAKPSSRLGQFELDDVANIAHDLRQASVPITETKAPAPINHQSLAPPGGSRHRPNICSVF